MKVLITGAGGMMGQALQQVCSLAGDEVFALSHQGLDIADARQVDDALHSIQPEMVVNCAAWTDVDACESDPLKASRVNAIGPENLARTSRQVGAGLVTISTDYVFDGRKQGFYTQRDQPNPESVYGKAKLEGERRAQAANARCTVVRTGFVFGCGGRNFLSTVIRRAQKHEGIMAITDAWGTPTFGPDLAGQLRRLALLDIPGVYHVVNSGTGASYEEFTRAALAAAGITEAEVEAISVDSLHRPAPRPRNSRLACLLSKAVGLPPLRNWREAVTEFAISQAQSEAAAVDKTAE